MNNIKENSSDIPVYLFKQGRNCRAYDFFGAHFTESGVVFRVWAPSAREVSVVGEFNSWDPSCHIMEKIADGIYEKEIEGIRQLIEIARPLSRESEEIYSIIGEEAAPYFAGQKSAAEVAKIIQSRIQIYVSENN